MFMVETGWWTLDNGNCSNYIWKNEAAKIVKARVRSTRAVAKYLQTEFPDNFARLRSVRFFLYADRHT